jgi:hypothetical protein
MIEVHEKSHAVLGPSGWATWGVCPGSIPLGDGIAKSSSSYAKEGTAAHALLEKCLIEGLDAETQLGEEIVVEGEVFVVDNEMADAINSSIDIIRNLIDYGGGDVLQVEQTVPLAFMTGEEGAEGTCDVAGISADGTTLTIIDFKYGQGVQVYASEKLDEKEAAAGLTPIPNGQLAMYALGWLQKHGFLFEDVEKVKLVVLQPRMEWVDELEMPLIALQDFEDVVRQAAGNVELNRQVQAEGNPLDLVPGAKQCKFCKAKGICPALRAETSKGLAVLAPSEASDFEDLTLPKQAAAVVVNEGVTNEKLAEFMRAVPLIEEAIGAARAETERRLLAGMDVPGFYLGIGRAGRRKWANEEFALKELTRSGRLKMSEAQAKKPISPTAAEKLLAKRPKVWAAIAPLITQSEGGPSVCREGDKNKPYQLASPPEAFANLDAPESVDDIMS